jgi:hypothetical protein
VKRCAALAAIAVAFGCSSDRKHAQKTDSETPGMHRADASTQDASESAGQDASAQDAATSASNASSKDASASSGACVPEELEDLVNVAFECDRCGPHGSCRGRDPNEGDCRCDPAFAGDRCERCADGFVEHAGECVTVCQAAGITCNGICSGTVAAPSCECNIGYVGPKCDQCAVGFGPDPHVFDGLACAPTCDGGCDTAEQCVAPSRSEQSCECITGYERDAKGTCKWQHFIADPGFEHGCADWQIFHRVANPTDKVITELAPGKLTLSVDHRCSVAGAKTAAFLPAQGESENAIAITAAGDAGVNLYVGFDDELFLAPMGMPLAGTGAVKRYVVCLPTVSPGFRAPKGALTLMVGELGTCMDPLLDRFEVHSIEVISDDQCGATR